MRSFNIAVDRSLAANGIDVERIKRLRIERQAGVVWASTYETLPSSLLQPQGWRLMQDGEDGRGWRSAFGGQATVIESVAREEDGRRWHHVSTARADRMPTWDEVRAIKEAFIGDREAYIVFPPKARYVNLHRFCLHLWACLDAPEGAVLPDFASGTGSI